MERLVTFHIELLPEGVYLATSDDVQGLMAQGRTVQETVEIARDLANSLIEWQLADRRVGCLQPTNLSRNDLH
jgi:predicted RNase H-like HicB family nuclease